MNVQLLALFATFFTGMTALIFEVTWQRYLTSIMGSHARATSIVLCIFLLGLGVGYLAFGKFSKGLAQRTLIRLCGVAEILIAACNILFIFIYEYLFSLQLIEYLWSFAPFLTDVFITAILIGPTCILMGATIPLLTQGLCTDLSRSNRLHAVIYGTNTLGAFVGCVIGSLFLLPGFGLQKTILLGSIVNLAAGSLLLFISKKIDSRKLNTQNVSQVTGEKVALHLLFLAFITGVIALGLQSFLIRIIGLSMGSSEYTFALVVAAFIVLIALGSLFLVRNSGPLLKVWQSLLLVCVSLSVVYFLVPYFPYIFHILRTAFGNSSIDFYLYYLTAFLLVLFIFGVPIACLGSLLPLLFASHKKNSESLGLASGSLYACNTIGCAFGAILFGYLLLSYFNFDNLFSFLILLCCLALFLVFPWKQQLGVGKIYVCLTLILPVLTLTNPWDKSRLGVGLFHERSASDLSYQGPNNYYQELFKSMKLIDYKDGVNATVAVAEFQEETGGISRSIYVNGKADGNTRGDRLTMKTLGHLAGLFSPSNDAQAAVVGLGTGMTLTALSLHPHIESIDSVDISSLMYEFGQYFSSATNNVLNNPKVQSYVEDAYRFFKASDKIYDTVVVQPSNPWLAGLDRLYSKEFYNQLKAKLSDAGVVVQWFSLWGSSARTTKIILNTFNSAFKQVRLFRFRDSVFLVGSKSREPSVTLEQVLKRFNIAAVNDDLLSIGYRKPEVLLGLEYWIPSQLYQSEEVNSLFHPILGFQSALDFFTDQNFELESIADLPSDWRYSLILSKQSLLAELVEVSRTIDFNILAEASCGGTQVELVEPNWRYTRTTCRDVTIARMLNKTVQAPEVIEPELAWVSHFLNQAVDERRPRNPVEALQEINLFTIFHSIFIPLSPSKLLNRASICYEENSLEHYACREQLIRTLAYSGELKLARSEFERLIEDGLSLSQLQTLETDLSGFENI